MAGLGQEMHVRGAGHPRVRAHDRDVLAVVPVGALGYVGLLPPDLGGGIGQVAVPVVKAQVGAAEQLHEAGAAGETEHRHGRNRREANQTVGAVLLDGVDGRGGDKLLDLLPAGAAEAALAAGLLVALAPGRIVDDRGPGGHRVGVLGFGLAPEIGEHSAQVGVLDAQRAVQIPGEGDTALAAARLVGGQSRLEFRVVGGLQLPADDAVLDVHVPRAAAGAVDPVGAAHHLVALVAVAIELFPGAPLRVDDILDPAHRSSPPWL